MDVLAIIVIIKRIVDDVVIVDRIHLEITPLVMNYSNHLSTDNIDLFIFLVSGTVGRNKPLNRSACRPKWKSDVPITENQLRRKREEYWDTGEIVEIDIEFDPISDRK